MASSCEGAFLQAELQQVGEGPAHHAGRAGCPRWAMTRARRGRAAWRPAPPFAELGDARFELVHALGQALALAAFRVVQSTRVSSLSWSSRSPASRT